MTRCSLSIYNPTRPIAISLWLGFKILIESDVTDVDVCLIIDNKKCRTAPRSAYLNETYRL